MRTRTAPSVLFLSPYAFALLFPTYRLAILVDVAVESSSGNVYVADSYNNRIQEFDSNGNFITKWGTEGSGDGQFIYPASVGVDSSSGNVYVADQGNYRIQKFDSNGNFITKWGTEGSGDGQLSNPSDIAVESSSGNVYVADANNDRIQKFDSNGNFITKWGSFGSGDDQFNYPIGIAFDPYDSGSVYVADANNDRIQKFDSNGNFITKWGSLGTEDGQFNYPTGIGINPYDSGNVYVADSGNARIQVFELNQTVNESSEVPITNQLPNASEIAGFQTYQNSTFGFKLSYPFNWYATDGYPFDNTVHFYPANTTQNTPNTYNGEFAVTIEKNTSSTEDELVNKIISSYAVNPDFTLINSSAKTTLAGNPAYQLVLTYSNPIYGKLLVMEVGAVIHETLYRLTYSVDPSNYHLDLPTVQEMIDSFDIFDTSSIASREGEQS